MSDSDIDVVKSLGITSLWDFSNSWRHYKVHTTATDGSEDDQIHCFKPEGEIPTGLDTLRKERNENNFLEMIDLIEEIDLIQDEENGILSDDSLEF
uniref:Uncharacterized protein n=1 Tax=Meloidogyne incognita TaxID=6306 RepID=A0A914LFE0_MELIC